MTRTVAVPARFVVLGPVGVSDHAGRSVECRGRARDLLALLLSRPNALLTPEALIDGLWSGRPPEGAAVSVRTYVHRLRRVFEERAPGQLIETHEGGYRLPVAPEAVDAERFASLVREAERRRQQGQARVAEALYDEALGLWQGKPFHGLALDVISRDVVPRLVELRYQARRARAEIRYELSHYADAVTELRSLAEERPEDEATVAALIRALRAQGRPSEVTDIFRVHSRQVEERFGAAPSPALRQLARQAAAPAPRTAAVLPPVPLRGREEELTRLVALYESGGLAQAGRSAGARVPVAVVCGLPGTGKSALARGVLHRLTEAGLRTAQLDVHQCHRVDQARGELRTAGDGLPDVLLLDGVRSPEVCSALLAGADARAVLITSRRPLAAVRADELLLLGGLDGAQAVRFLREQVGAARVDAEPVAAERIVHYCDGHPLALRIVSIKLLLSPHQPLSRLAQRLSDPAARITELDVDGLALSPLLADHFASCSERDRQVFRRLCRLPVSELTVAQAARVLGCAEGVAQNRLDDLVVARLLRSAPKNGRYRMSRLCQGYATATAVPWRPWALDAHPLSPRAAAHSAQNGVRAAVRGSGGLDQPGPGAVRRPGTGA